MAKERTITRTIETVKAMVFVMNIETATTEKREVTATGKVTESELLEVARKEHETDVEKVVALVPETVVVSSGLYEMSEKDFLANAKYIGTGR